MKSRVLSALVLLGLVSCGESTEPVSRVPEVSPATMTTSSTSPRANASPAVLAAARARESTRAARAVAEVERRFATRTPGLEFRVRHVRTDVLGDTHVWIQQVFQGTPVTGRDLGVIVDVDDTLRVFGEPDDFGSVPPPRLTAAAGLARASTHAASSRVLAVSDGSEAVLEPLYERRLRKGARGDNASDYETVVTGFERGVRVKLATPRSPREPRELFVRERDGAVLERAMPPAGMVNATLRSRYAGTQTGLQTYLDPVKNVYRLESQFYDQVVYSPDPRNTPGVSYRNLGNTWGDGQPYGFGDPLGTNGQTAAADAFISLYGTHRMFLDVFGWYGWDGQGAPVTAFVHMPEDNAYAVGNGVIWLGYLYDKNGPNQLSNIALTDIETVAHETGHMVYDELTHFTPVTDIGEMMGMNEGTADIFGLIGGFYLPDALTPTAPCTGRLCNQTPTRKHITVRGDWMAGNVSTPGIGRSFIDPYFPYWTPALQTQDGHYAAGPLARMFYFLSVGVLPDGQAPVPGLLNPQRVSLFLPRGMTGLGIDTASWLWYLTVSGGYFARIHDYHSAREMMLEATTTVFQHKPYTPEYKAVEDAWAAVNIGPPADRKLPEVTLTAQQTWFNTATVTVDITDDTGVESGTVVITSATTGGPVITAPCTGHCVFNLNPVTFGTSTAHTVKVTARDTRENEASKQISFALDGARPNVTLTSNKGSTWSPSAPQQDWAYNATDTTGLSTLRLFVAGEETLTRSWNSPYPPSFYLSNVVVDVSTRPDGFYPVRFETTDPFGNQHVNAYSLIVDRAPPNLCQHTVTVDPSNNGNVTLKVTGRDDLSGLTLLALHRTPWGLLKNDQTKVAGGVERSLSFTETMAPGTYTYFATCMDQYSNVFKTPYVNVTVMGRCNTTAVAGGAQMDERTFVMGKASGTVTLKYQTFTVHDRIRVYSGTTMVADTGCVATGADTVYATKTFNYSGTTGQLRVQVDPNCNPVTALPTTEWNYSLSCP